MPSLAVVPIFVNAVPALFPAIFAGSVAFVSVLFKPRELAQLCRSRPGIPLGIAGGILLLTLGGFWLFGGENTANGAARSPANAAAMAFGQRDWAKVARRSSTGRRRTGSARLRQRCRRRPTRRGDPSRSASAGTSAAAATTAAPRRSGSSASGSTMRRRRCSSRRRWLRGTGFTASCQLDVTGKYGAVFCLDAQSGKPLWQTTTVTAADAGDENLKPFFSSPALTADGRSPADRPGPAR